VRTKLFLIFTILFAGPAVAYVGPGAGISVLGALWGLIIGVVMALGVILFWPIRMMIRKIKANKTASSSSSEADTSETQDAEQGEAVPSSSSSSSSSSSQTP
jgi:cytoskeletal protein RodZ